MIDRPQFKAPYRVEVVPGEGVLVLSDGAQAVLSGRAFERVAPLVDGRRTADDIVDALDGNVSAAEVYYAIARLEQRGYIEVSRPPAPTADAVFHALHGVGAAEAAQRLTSTRVRVVAVGGLDAGPMADALAAAQVCVDEPGDLDVVVTDDYLRGDLACLNRDAVGTGRAWMLVRPVGQQILVGPIFSRREDGCWECLARRLRLTRSVEAFVAKRTGQDVPIDVPRAATAATVRLACGLAAAEAAAWIARGDAPHQPTVLAFDAISYETSRHVVTRQPDCPVCGTPASRATEWPPVLLQSRRKTYTEDGGHRAATPEEMLARFERHVSPITGAVSMLKRHPAGNGPLHVYFAGDNFAVPQRGLKDLRENFRNRSSGKGASDAQAKASCLGEALERYSACFRGTEPRVRSSMTRLGTDAIHPNACMRFSDRQYRERETINARGDKFHRVPPRFDPDAEIDWAPIWSLTHKTHRFVPTGLCYFGYPSTPHYSVPCSNGNAAGNTIEEAILQGFLELVERDSVGLWWYNRTRVPAIDLDSFDEPYFRTLQSFFRERGRELWALDLTSDLGIPVCAAISRRIDGTAERVMFGFGAHLEPRIAIMRALTELNQFLICILEPGSEMSERPEMLDDDEILRWLKTSSVTTHAYLAPHPTRPPVTARSYPVRWSDDLRDDIDQCRQLVERSGLEVLVLDQTRADIGLPVAKVIVPGLRHFWPRFAAGRLYDVPQALGWIDRRVPEEELNPVAMFL